MRQVGTYEYDTPTLANGTARGMVGWGSASPYRAWGKGNIIVPLFPLVALSMLPLPFVLGVTRRWRWWREIVPAVPCLLLTVGLIGIAGRHLVEREGLLSERQLHLVSTLVEATGILTFVPGLLVWLAMLPRNVRSRRRDREPTCARCGYILKGLSQPRCPECGTTFVERTADGPPR